MTDQISADLSDQQKPVQFGKSWAVLVISFPTLIFLSPIKNY